MNPTIAWLLTFLLFPHFVLAQEATATLLEGTVWVIRGASVLQCAEGMRLRQGDMLETTTPAFAQLEFSEGTIVAIGPASRAFLFRTSGTGADLVLLNGWLKGESGAKSVPFRYNTPLLGVATKDGTFVLHASQSGAEIFVESGSGTISEVSPQGNLGHTVSVKSGQFLTRKSGKNVATAARADEPFLTSMSPAFRDTLPSRLSRFQGKKPPTPRADHEVTYAEIQPWLT